MSLRKMCVVLSLGVFCVAALLGNGLAADFTMKIGLSSVVTDFGPAETVGPQMSD